MSYAPHPSPAAGKPSIGGQILCGLAQFFILGIATVVVVVAFFAAMVETGRFLEAEAINAAQAKDEEADFQREASYAVANQANFRSQGAEWEKTLQAFVPRQGQTPLETTPAAANSAAPEPKDDPLVAHFQDTAQALAPADLQAIYQLADGDPRRPLIAAALRQRAETASAPLRDLAAIAVSWNDAELGQAIVAAYAEHPELLAGASDFYALRNLGARWRDPRTPALALRCLDKELRRGRGGFPDSGEMHKYGEAFAVLAPLDPELLAAHAGHDTPAGDVVRGALFRLSDWPAPVVAEVEKAFTNANELFEVALTQWVTDMPPPVPVRDKLFAVVARKIPRQGAGDARQDLKATALLPELATANTIGSLVKAALRLEASNPAAARALALRAMRSHPRETASLLAEAAAAGNVLPPPRITDPWWTALQAEAQKRGGKFLPPVITSPRWATEIDAAVASVLIEGKPSAGLVAVAAEWGGALSASLLEKAVIDAPATDADALRAAVQTIRARAPAEEQ